MTRNNSDIDMWSHQNNSKIVTYEDIIETAERIKPFVINTPCLPSHYQRDFVIHLYYKMEFMQNNGSVKDRGIVNLLDTLPLDKKKIGVVIASIGNFAISFSQHACKMKIPVIVIFPFTAPINKVQKCHDFGAKVFLQGNDLTEAEKYARAIAKERGMTFINSRDHPNLLAGYGSIAIEILEQVPLVDAIIVPVGFGGLVASIATVIKNVKPQCLVYGVQAENAPAFFESLAKSYEVSVPPQDTTADAIAMANVGCNSFQMARPLLDKMLLVKEEWISQAIYHLADKERFVVEGAAACTLATIIGKLVPEFKTKNVVCVLSGGNVDPILHSHCLERGLASECYLVKFRVDIKDNSVALAQLMRLLADGGYKILDPIRDDKRINCDESIFSVTMDLICEAKGLEHALQLKRIVEKAYPSCSTFETKPFNDRNTCPCHVYKKPIY